MPAHVRGTAAQQRERTRDAAEHPALAGRATRVRAERKALARVERGVQWRALAERAARWPARAERVARKQARAAAEGGKAARP
jgi:hypothetical protein